MSDDLTCTPFSRFDPDTGAILETGVMSHAGVQALTDENGWHYIKEASRLGEDYVSLPDLTITPRQPCPASLDGLVLSDLPVPCCVKVRDEAGEQFETACDEPSLELEFDYPGTYTVTVVSVPYLDGVFTVEVP